MSKYLLMAMLFWGAAFRAGATDYTDVWWNAAESGWGANFVQSDKFIFASFFVYGPGNAPTWYSGELTLSANGSFTGPLYATVGSYFGAASFNPAQTMLTRVGTVTFTPTAADTGVLTYNVGSVSVTKSIQRLTLTPIPLSGSYAGGVVVALSGCANAAENGSASGPVDVEVVQSPGQIGVTLDVLGILSCTLSSNAAIAQSGPLFSFPARYSCAGDPDVMSGRVYELRATSLGIEGRWTATDTLASSPTNGCREDGRFSAVKK